MPWTLGKQVVGALCLAASICALSSTAKAQRSGIVLSVVVRDADTGEPVAGAEVTVRDANLQSRTDSLGRVVFSNVPTPSGSIDVRRLGYASLETTFRSAERDTVRLMVRLEPVAQALPRASVVDTEGLSRLPEFESRHGKRFGRFITEKEIRAALGSTLSDLVMTKIPGLRISYVPGFGAKAYSTRGPRSIHVDLCQVAVYLDGVRVSNGVVDLVALSLLAGVEYYPPGFVPVQYKVLGAAPGMGRIPSEEGGSAECGVLLLWTIR